MNYIPYLQLVNWKKAFNIRNTKTTQWMPRVTKIKAVIYLFLNSFIYF